jgi:hypothetical protein
MIGSAIDTLSTMLNLTQIMSVADNILAFIRTHSGEDIRCLASYGLAATGIDGEGRLHAFMFLPDEQTLEETLTLREQTQDLLPTE